MKVTSLLVVSLLGAIAPTAAFAQATGTERPERPYRGMFGSGTANAEQVLSVTGSIGAGYDTDASADAGLGIDAGNRLGGSGYALASGSLSYSHNTDRVGFGASASSMGRYYKQAGNTILGSHAASVGGNFSLNEQTQFTASQSLTYQPSLTFAPFVPLGESAPGQVPPPDQDLSLVGTGYSTLVSGASITRQLSRQSSVAASYSYQSNRGGGEAVEDHRTQSGAIRFTRGLTRNLALRLGYGLTEARLGGSEPYRSHNIDTGVDYSRSLSLTRRTQLAFSSGVVAVRQDDITRYDAIGNASLSRELGRTWSASIAYSRNVSYLVTLREPYFSDGVSAGVAGLAGPRVSIRSGVGMTMGEVGLVSTGEGDRSANTWFGNAGMTIGITRNIGVSLDYTFYRYGFGADAPVTSGLARELDRHSIRVTLNTWAPIFQRGRRTDAAR